MDGNAVRWFEIYVQDVARAKTFYETVFETKLTRLPTDHPEMWTFRSGKDEYGTTGALVKMEGVPSGGNSTLVYFSSHDCSVEASRVEKAGGKIHRSKTSIGEYGAIVLAFDTEGNMFGIHSMA